MNQDERSVWLKSLKVGDEVSINDEVIRKITLIVRGCFQVGGQMYSRKGYHSDTWHPSELLPVTDELRAKLAEREKRTRLVSELRRVRFESIPTAKLEEIWAVVTREVKS